MPLAGYCSRAALTCCSLVLLAALGAGMVRLLPWLLAPDVPLRVALPFTKALVAVAVESSLLVGLPTGFAFAAGVFNERGEARALLSLGATPWMLARSTWRHLAAFAALIWLLSLAWDPGADRPGRFAAQLIEQSKTACHAVSGPRAVLVPMVGVSWLCFPGRPARVTGTLPGTDRRAWFTAAEIHPSDDLQRFELSDLRLVARGKPSMPALQLHVDSARISGLLPWGRSAKLPVQLRAALVTGSAVALGLLAVWFVIRRALSSRLGAAASGAVPALVVLEVLHEVDSSAASGLLYALVPIAGIVALFGLALLTRLAKSLSALIRRARIARGPAG
jgi:hypothetical protein